MVSRQMQVSDTGIQCLSPVRGLVCSTEDWFQIRNITTSVKVREIWGFCLDVKIKSAWKIGAKMLMKG